VSIEIHLNATRRYWGDRGPKPDAMNVFVGYATFVMALFVEAKRLGIPLGPVAADPGSVVNVIRDLRQRGFVWPPPKKAELLHARLSEMLSENGVEPRITSTPFPPQPNPDVQVIVTNGAAKALGHKKPGAQLPPPQDVDPEPRFTFHDAAGPARVGGAKPTAAALPPDSEQLFAQLKEAKEHARLAGAYLQECETQRDHAQLAVDAAAREHEEALLAYKAARERFDKAFELE